MPAKKVVAKAKSHSSEAIDINLQNCLIRINNGSDVYGMVAVQLDSWRAPKTCELITQNIPSANANEKTRQKQGFYRSSRFLRVTKEGIQTGDVAPPQKSVPVGDLEGEMGRVPHSFGTLSLCRSSSTFDGSQFFICLTNDPVELDHMNRKYVAFGHVMEGHDVLSNLVEDIKPYVGEMGTVSTECPFVMAELTFASM